MKHLFFFTVILGCAVVVSCNNPNEKKAESTETATTTETPVTQSYYIDVHNLEPGKVTFADVAAAHQKDLATQGKHDVHFIKYWLAEKEGKIYCLSQANNASDVATTHKEAHGLVPAEVYQVTQGQAAPAVGNKPMFIDIHEMGAGKVTAADVEAAHQKDLATEAKYGVNFTNYYVDTDKGIIFCMSEAADSNAVKNTHNEAHGLHPAMVLAVKEGQ